MITLKTGNILEEQVDALVNPVNCVGIMGKGLALQFKNTYPDNFDEYHLHCGLKKIKIGKVHVHKTILNIPKYIINFPTKNHWRDKSKLEWIDKGIDDLKEQIKNYEISSIAIPALGCGLGGLEWKDVLSIINKKMIYTHKKIIVFEPGK